jgi:hypothetical protein
MIARAGLTHLPADEAAKVMQVENAKAKLWPPADCQHPAWWRAEVGAK